MSLGWFLGTIGGMVKKNPGVTIAEALGEGYLWECKMEGCHRPFATQSAVRIHFSHAHAHAACTQEGWEASMRRLKQSWTLDQSEEEARSGTEVETGADARGGAGARGRGDDADAGVEVIGNVEGGENRDERRIVEIEDGKQNQGEDQIRNRNQNQNGNQNRNRDEAHAERRERRGIEEANEATNTSSGRRDHGLRINPRRIMQRQEEQREAENEAQIRREHIRRREMLEEVIDRGVNIPQLNDWQLRKVKVCLSERVQSELNPRIERMLPRTEEWVAFEGAYDESMHQIREHIIRAIGRDPTRIYGRGKLNPRIQKAMEESAEMVFELQKVRRDLTKLKDIVHQIVERGEESGGENDQDVETCKQQAKFTKRFSAIVGLLDEDTLERYFRAKEHEEIWRLLNTSFRRARNDEEESTSVEDSRSISHIEEHCNEEIY
jgi:hypothetical protein